MGDTLIINVDVLEEVAKTLKQYSNAVDDLFKNTLHAIIANEDEWQDRDFDDLVSAVKALSSEVVFIKNAVSSLTSRINNKINAIQQLHNLQI